MVLEVLLLPGRSSLCRTLYEKYTARPAIQFDPLKESLILLKGSAKERGTRQMYRVRFGVPTYLLPAMLKLLNSMCLLTDYHPDGEPHPRLVLELHHEVGVEEHAESGYHW